MTTTTQLRAVCPVCFATQALDKYGRLVQHGYRRPEHWQDLSTKELHEVVAGASQHIASARGSYDSQVKAQDALDAATEELSRRVGEKE